MKKLLTLMVLIATTQLVAQEENNTNILDGTSVLYNYENEAMGAVQAEFIDGHFKFKFIKGAYEGAEGITPYQAKKIGDQMYMVSSLNKENSNFVTFVFNFKEKAMYSSVLVEPKSENEMVLFEEGLIEQSTLKEN